MQASFKASPRLLTRAQGADWRKALLIAFVVWAVVALSAAAADYSDQLRHGGAPRFVDTIEVYSLVFLPFSLLSGLLAALFARLPQRWLSPRPLLLVFALVQLVFLPAYGMYEMAALTALEGKPVPGLLDLLLQPNAWGRFLDGLMISLAFMAQACHSYWQRGHHQERASLDARRANLTMRLALLQGQLEPYFLLNSLDGIGELVRNADRVLATRALARLSDLLRYALRSSQQARLNMADEIGFIRDYFALQGLRFGAGLEVQWQVADLDWSGRACPALLLHPLAEQAIMRGMREPAGVCRLRVAITLRADQVVVEVERARAGPAEPHPGLGDTAERLQLLFGGAASLSIASDRASECVTMAFPAQARDDD